MRGNRLGQSGHEGARRGAQMDGSMTGRKLGVPSMNMLVAFEAAGRLSGVNRAAEVLRVAPSAVSRNISNLESHLGVQLYERDGKRMILTESGREYLDDVQVALNILRNAGEIARCGKTTVAFACRHELSVMVLRPIYSTLKHALGKYVNLQVLSCDYDAMINLTSADVIMSFDGLEVHPSRYGVEILEEEVVPIASPRLMRRFRSQLLAHPRDWLDVPRLSHVRSADKWASWNDWFRAHGCEIPQARVEEFEDYYYVVEAAADGEGIALGWNGYVNRYFESGRLIPVHDVWWRTPTRLYAVLTANGMRKPSARRFLKEFRCSMRKIAEGGRTFVASHVLA